MPNYKVIFLQWHNTHVKLSLSSSDLPPLISQSSPKHLYLVSLILILPSNPLVPRPVSLQTFILVKYCRGEGRHACEFSCRTEVYSFNIINQNLPNSIVSHKIEPQNFILPIYGQGKQFLIASFFFLTCFSWRCQPDLFQKVSHTIFLHNWNFKAKKGIWKRIGLCKTRKWD